MHVQILWGCTRNRLPLPHSLTVAKRSIRNLQRWRRFFRYWMPRGGRLPGGSRRVVDGQLHGSGNRGGGFENPGKLCWFPDQCIESCGESELCDIVLGPATEGDQAWAACAVHLAHLARELEAAHSRHLKVANHYGGKRP